MSGATFSGVAGHSPVGVRVMARTLLARKITTAVPDALIAARADMTATLMPPGPLYGYVRRANALAGPCR